MTGDLTSKVRLVRCPRCRNLLPEVADIPIYKCGGCGTTLRAKRRQNDSSTSSGSQESSAAQGNGLNQVSEDNESNSSNVKADLSSEEHFLEQSAYNDLYEDLNRNGQQFGVVNMPGEKEETNERDQNKHEKNKYEEPGILNPPNADQDHDGTDGNPSENFDDEHSEDVKKEELTDVQPRIIKLFEDKESECDRRILEDHDGELHRDSDKQPGVEHSLRGTDCGIDLNEPDLCDREQAGDLDSMGDEELDLTLDDKEYGTDQNDSGDCNMEQPAFSYESTSHSELAGSENDENSTMVRVDMEASSENESSPLASVKSEAKVRGETYFASGEMITDSPRAMVEVGSITAQRQADRRDSSDCFTSSPYELEKTQRTAHVFDHSRSIDTFETTGYGSQSSEFSGNREDLPKSSTIKSSYAYEGSVSSFDGTDSYFLNKHSRAAKFTNETADFYRSNGRPRKGKQPMESRMYRSAELQGLARKPISVPDKKPYTMESRPLDSVEYPDPVRHVRSVGKCDSSESEQHPYWAPLNQKSTLEGYDSPGPSSKAGLNFQDSAGYHSPGRLVGTERERLELLRIVYELQDKLNKTQLLKGASGGSVSTELPRPGKHFPDYYNQEAPEGDVISDFGYPRYPGRHTAVNRMGNQHGLSGTTFSGVAYQQADNSYHGFRQDWRYSAPLPPRVPYQNYADNRVHSGWNSVYGSSCSSPQRYAGSGFPLRNGEVNLDDQIREYQAIKIHLKEKSYSDKQHYLPTAGAAPFITCYRCLSLLQLPVDFLLIKRRYHMLKCGYCSEVLKFSLQNRGHIAPYTRNFIPLSEVDGFSDTTSGQNAVSTSYDNDGPQLDPVSCSDDIGDSFFTSCSTEKGDIPTESQRNTYGRMLSGDSSLQSVREHREIVQKQFRNKFRNEGETSAANSPSPSKLKSKKISSKERELLPTSNSPLHQLMGYSSPHDLMRGIADSASPSSSASRD